MLDQKPKILFLSTGDATRSRMAKAFFRRLEGERYDVVSTAVKAEALHPQASDAMREVGIDISCEASESIAEVLKKQFMYVVTICDATRERHPIFPFTPRLLHWSIADPAGSEGSAEQGLALLRRVRDDIAEQVSRIITEIGPAARTAASPPERVARAAA